VTLTGKLDFHGWSPRDLTFDGISRGECPETGELGCEEIEGWEVSLYVNIPGRAPSRFFQTEGNDGIGWDIVLNRGVLRMTKEFPGMRDLASQDGVEDLINFKFSTTAFHGSWPEKDYRIYDLRGPVRLLDRRHDDGDNPVAIQR
jgi:hypothetical protein